MQGESQSRGVLYWARVLAIGRKPKRTFLRIATLVVLTVILFKFILLPIRVTGMSMEPTCHNGSVNFINRLSYLHSEPRRGDVVGIRSVAGEHVLLMKRIVGLPGETVSYEEGHVCIDGVPQPEPYLKYVIAWKMSGRKLGPDQYYVVGDNRSMPREYHTEGVTERWQIIGRVLWPWNPVPHS